MSSIEKITIRQKGKNIRAKNTKTEETSLNLTILQRVKFLVEAFTAFSYFISLINGIYKK
jgi:hypothetical protein